MAYTVEQLAQRFTAAVADWPPVTVTGQLYELRPHKWITYGRIRSDNTTLDVTIPNKASRHKVVAGTWTLTGRMELSPRFGLTLKASTAHQVAATPATPTGRQGSNAKNLAHQIGPRILLICPRSGHHGREDFLRILNNDPNHQWHITQRATPMEGPQAPGAVATEIANGYQWNTIDTIAVIRGGGDEQTIQQTFGHPDVINTIRNATKPVILGIGHATDLTPAGYAATYQALTPTDAAIWLTTHCK